MLHEFIAKHREEIISRCRAKVATRSIPPPTELELDHGVPVFLDQLGDALRLGGQLSSPDICTSALRHGHELWLQGFTVSQVVHDYGNICQAITELAVEVDAPISTDDFRMLNRCLDDAIAGAVTEFGRGRDQFALLGEMARGSERLGFLAHELRNLVNTAMVAFEVLKTGNVGVAGSTGAVLQRSLTGIANIVGRSLGEVRLSQGVQNPTRFQVAGFIDELAAAAALEANTRGVTFTATPIQEDLEIEVDRQVLSAVVMNLLQNAFKFTRPRTAVAMRVVADADRVRFEIQDECGGLPPGDAEGLFRPFEQRSPNRTGLGLGLAFSRWGIEANHGRLHVRSLPDVGCVFTVDLPRCPVAVNV